MEPLSFELARKTVKRYACSTCWGELEMNPDPEHAGAYQVTCKKCGIETRGYVTQYFVNRRRGESESEQREATHLLRSLKILPNPLEGKSKEQILKELGY